MKRLAVGISVLLLWALVPGTGEIFENAMHLVTEGHAAHAAPAGDDHDEPGPEHGCSGSVHLCSCCASLSCVPTQSLAQHPVPGPRPLPDSTDAGFPDDPQSGVYHPPRA